MKKYGTPEKLEVFTGEAAGVVNKHLSKLGKAVSDFTDEEKEALQKDLEALEPEVEEVSNAISEDAAEVTEELSE